MYKLILKNTVWNRWLVYNLQNINQGMLVFNFEKLTMATFRHQRPKWDQNPLYQRLRSFQTFSHESAPPLGFEHPLSKAVLQSLAPFQITYSLNFWHKYSISCRRNDKIDSVPLYRCDNTRFPKKKMLIVSKLTSDMNFQMIQAKFLMTRIWRAIK